jgi:hypothetical protein
VRLPDEEYYQDDVTAHTAQGDLYEDVPFGYTTVLDSGFEVLGTRPRPVESESYDVPMVGFHALGVVCSYTCGFVAQPPGTKGYSHPYRLIAPVVPLRDAVEWGLPLGQARNVRDRGGVNGLMYLPWPEADDTDDEWRGQGVALLFRPGLVTQPLLATRRRIGRLRVEALRILEVRLIQTVAPPLYEPADMDPDISDSWTSQS